MTVLNEICKTHGWTLDVDLTETSSGLATPVARVIVDDGRALLRLDRDPGTAEAYQAFSDSGVTPHVHAVGQDHGSNWLLVEWVEGESAMDRCLANPDTALHTLQDASARVAEATLALPPLPAPTSALTEFDSDVRILEAHMVVDGKLAQSTPMLHKLGAEWTPAVRLHGDATPANVIFGPSGETRLIDVRGDWGPVERSIAQWSAALVFMAQRRDDPADFEGFVADAVRLTEAVADVAPTLDRSRISRWTAEQLCRAAWELKESGVRFEQWRALVAVAGRVWVEPAEPPRVGRNDRCPCGSGRKFKICHGG